jgi:hypothetical protein
MDCSGIYRVSRIAPQIMSLLALAICAVGWAGVVRDPPGDEGALAHVYQLVMAGQIPLIVIFLVTGDRFVGVSRARAGWDRCGPYGPAQR